MKFSVRAAAAVALTACAGVGAAQAATAAGMSPDRLEAAEQSAAATRVPFDLPLGSAVQTVTGDSSFAGVDGSLPGMPVLPPTPGHREPQSLLPEPLVPALASAHSTPELNLVAPALGGDGSVRPQGLVASLPESPIDARGVGATLGDPVTWSKGDSGAASSDERIDLGRLAPALTTPRLESSPSGSVSLDQRTMDRPLDRTVDEFLTTTAATAQELRQ